MRIAVDVMGFDGTPDHAIVGALEAVTPNRNQGECCPADTEITLLGDGAILQDRIQALMDGGSRGEEAPWSRIGVRHCPTAISPSEPAVWAIKNKQDSSLVTGLKLLKDKQVDAFVSAGSTGALVAGGLLILGRSPGVDRPALAVLLPTAGGRPTVLVDAGANTEVKAKNLVQFAVMGSSFASKALGRENPSVGLLNVGVESEKGTDAIKQAYAQLRSTPLNFKGNVEGRDVPAGAVDVLVCDGFVGNVLLKFTEGMGLVLLKLAGQALGDGLRGSSLLDYREYGGAPLLGLNGVVMKCHGSSDARAFRKAIIMASRYVLEGGVRASAEILAGLDDA